MASYPNKAGREMPVPYQCAPLLLVGALSARAVTLITAALNSPSGRIVVAVDRSGASFLEWRETFNEIARAGAPVAVGPVYWPVGEDPVNEVEAEGGGVQLWEVRALGHAADTFQHMNRRHCERWALHCAG